MEGRIPIRPTRGPYHWLQPHLALTSVGA